MFEVVGKYKEVEKKKQEKYESKDGLMHIILQWRKRRGRLGGDRIIRKRERFTRRR